MVLKSPEKEYFEITAKVKAIEKKSFKSKGYPVLLRNDKLLMKFVPDLSNIPQPLIQLLYRKVEIFWERVSRRHLLD